MRPPGSPRRCQGSERAAEEVEEPPPGLLVRLALVAVAPDERVAVAAAGNRLEQVVDASLAQRGVEAGRLAGEEVGIDLRDADVDLRAHLRREPVRAVEAVGREVRT